VAGDLTPKLIAEVSNFWKLRHRVGANGRTCSAHFRGGSQASEIEARSLDYFATDQIGDIRLAKERLLRLVGDGDVRDVCFDDN